MERKHIYSVSFGKDSVAMLLLGIDKGLPIDEVVFFNIGVEFDAIYMVRDIESDYNQLPGEPYPTIAINDTGNPERMIEFYVTGKQYDVYHVAFKGFTKG